jgi:hypothetical protein
MIPITDMFRSRYGGDDGLEPIAVASDIKDEDMNMRQSEINAKLLKLIKAAL